MFETPISLNKQFAATTDCDDKAPYKNFLKCYTLEGNNNTKSISPKPLILQLQELQRILVGKTNEIATVVGRFD